jgi:hypothetical protein
MCEYATLHGRIYFADLISLVILSWGDYFGLSGWAHCSHRSIYGHREEGDKRSRLREDVRMKTEVREGAMTQGTQAVSIMWKRKLVGFPY